MLAQLLRALLLVGALTSAQDTNIVNPTTAAASAKPLPTALNYAYAGCFNESVHVPGGGGVRALNNGNFSANNTMTIDSCLAYCGDASMQYAGLEYGRECYCAPYLSSLSEKLNDSSCNYACNGNSSQICGGSLTLTLYNRTSTSKTGMAWSVGSQAQWYGAAAFAFMVFAAFL